MRFAMVAPGMQEVCVRSGALFGEGERGRTGGGRSGDGRGGESGGWLKPGAGEFSTRSLAGGEHQGLPKCLRWVRVRHG